MSNSCEIKTKKELLSLLNDITINLKAKEQINKLFSISKNNYYKCFLENDNTLLFTYEDDNIECFTRMYISAIKSPLKILFDNIKIKSTNFNFTQSWLKHYIVFSDHTVKYITTKNLFNTIKNLGQYDIVSTWHSADDYYKTLFKGSCFRELSYSESPKFSKFYICLEDISIFKKGMFIDYKYIYNRNNKVKDVLNESSKYTEFRSLSCDFNTISYEELLGIKPYTHTCSKQKFGCQNGCTNYCLSDGVNNFNNKLKILFINLYKEIFNITQ